MAKFKTGDDPKDHSVREVVDYLKGDEATPDEHDRVMAAERSRDGGGRAGIISMSGADDGNGDVATQSGSSVGDAPLEGPSGEPVAGPNEAVTGQESPADQAKTVDDPQASGDAGVTADQYPDEAPAALGPDMPQSDAERDAHAQTIVATAQATQTPDEARALAAKLSEQWKTPRNSSAE